MKLPQQPVNSLPKAQILPAGSWAVAEHKFESTRDLVDQVKLEGSGQGAVFHYQAPGNRHRILDGLKGAGIGAVAGALVSAVTGHTAVSTLLGGVIGTALGAVLSPRETLHKGIAGRLAAGAEGLAFTPNNDTSRTTPLTTLAGQSVETQVKTLKPGPADHSLSISEIKAMPEYNWQIPTRTEQIDRLKDTTQEWDMLVIGGGATGSGTALEGARRGLKVACLEAFDFSSGTSSKSTKLVHGGVRYLEKAVKKMDKEQYALVKEGLEERGVFLNMAPHLTDELRLVTPCYKRLDVPYYAAGLWLYDRIAGQAGMSATKILSAKEAKEQFPMIKDEGLKGAVAYSDGEFNDARMNVSLATTAAAHGAAVANYCEVLSLIKDEGKVVGAEVRDKRSGDTFKVRSKTVVNATGPFIDGIRKMDDAKAQDLVVPSAGTHIFVPSLHVPEGVLIPSAPNGSVAFFKPFEGGTLIGTTEEKTSLTMEPQTTAEQVEYLRNLANDYLNPQSQIQPDDIKSVWTGIRPLVKDPTKVSDGKTVELVRNHMIDVSSSGLVTIGGGKWTSFGRMAQDTVDQAIETGRLPQLPCQREDAKVVGAHGYSPELAGQLQQAYGLEPDVANHLARNYGDRALKVAELAQQGLGARLYPDYPYVEAEVVHALREEYATNPVDILSRRTRLSFVDEKATAHALPRVVQIMAKEAGWDAATAARELEQATAFYARNGMHGLKS